MVPINHAPRPSLPREPSWPAGLLLYPACDPFLSTEAPPRGPRWLSLMSQPLPHLSLFLHSVPLCGEIPVQQHPAQMPLCFPQEAALSLCLVLVSVATSALDPQAGWAGSARCAELPWTVAVSVPTRESPSVCVCLMVAGNVDMAFPSG